ncbi:hypothetical protein [Candidatus Igneacidithiobacillus taiwanensis]|uniref:hypothetical protein n=1 Tax=Candidatus Igneacidithiobacillus taiwanensis TaxID=1945924 RepID=UPI002898930D|nr:hypothetical protein [Candidatus Igneacidithiobacillus taiwanensis]
MAVSSCRARIICFVYRVDEKLIAFFARPGPHRAAEDVLKALEWVEKLVFWPFSLLTKPAEILLAGIERKQEDARIKRKGRGHG